MQKIKKITLAATILIATFMILHLFDSVEIWRENWFDEELLPAGSCVKEGAISNGLPFVLIAGILQIVFLWFRNGNRQMISLIVSVISAVCSLRILLCAILGGPIDGIIGGLATTIYVVTIPGYSIVILSWVIVIIQLWLLKLRKGGKQSEFYSISND